MNYLYKFFGHLRNIIVHKKWVFYYSCKLGIPYRGIIHDLSKFSPIEFFESVKYYQGSSSPIPVCKKEKGYSKAWQHHKGRNPHHYEYWTDNYDSGTTCIKIPYVYVLEMVADWLAAGRTYQGTKFNYQDEVLWWDRKKEIAKIHRVTKGLISYIFNLINDTNIDGFEYIKTHRKGLEKCYEQDKLYF